MIEGNVHPDKAATTPPEQSKKSGLPRRAFLKAACMAVFGGLVGGMPTFAQGELVQPDPEPDKASFLDRELSDQELNDHRQLIEKLLKQENWFLYKNRIYDLDADYLVNPELIHEVKIRNLYRAVYGSNSVDDQDRHVNFDVFQTNFRRWVSIARQMAVDMRILTPHTGEEMAVVLEALTMAQKVQDSTFGERFSDIRSVRAEPESQVRKKMLQMLVAGEPGGIGATLKRRKEIQLQYNQEPEITAADDYDPSVETLLPINDDAWLKSLGSFFSLIDGTTFSHFYRNTQATATTRTDIAGKRTFWIQRVTDFPGVLHELLHGVNDVLNVTATARNEYGTISTALVMAAKVKMLAYFCHQLQSKEGFQVPVAKIQAAIGAEHLPEFEALLQRVKDNAHTSQDGEHILNQWIHFLVGPAQAKDFYHENDKTHSISDSLNVVSSDRTSNAALFYRLFLLSASGRMQNPIDGFDYEGQLIALLTKPGNAGANLNQQQFERGLQDFLENADVFIRGEHSSPEVKRLKVSEVMMFVYRFVFLHSLVAREQSTSIVDADRYANNYHNMEVLAGELKLLVELDKKNQVFAVTELVNVLKGVLSWDQIEKTLVFMTVYWSRNDDPYRTNAEAVLAARYVFDKVRLQQV